MRRFTYQTLSHLDIEAALKEDDGFAVLLPRRHGMAFLALMRIHGHMSLIDQVESQPQRKVWVAIKGLFLTLWLIIAHSKIFELFGVVVIEKVSIAWPAPEEHEWLLSVKRVAESNHALNSDA